MFQQIDVPRWYLILTGFSLFYMIVDVLFWVGT